MNKDEWWSLSNNEVLDFMEKNHMNPSSYRRGEHYLMNWIKANGIR